MKTCPFCAEDIQDAAIVCKHCKRDLVAAPVAAAQPVTRPPVKKKSSVPGNIAWTIIVLIGGSIVFSLMSPTSSPGPTPEMIAKGERVVEGSIRDGLIERIEQPASVVYVDPQLWASLDAKEKQGFSVSCAWYFKARGGPGFANIHDNMSGKRLAHVVPPASFVLD